jgi:nucleoside-diphosphate-sugar epimerase
MSQLLCLGLGYCASRLAAKLLSGSVAGGAPRDGSGWHISGTSRDPSSDVTAPISMLRFAGAEDVTQLVVAINEASHILISIAPDAEGDPVLRHLSEVLLAASHLEWIGYLSTTGVYGNTGGAWADESTPPKPTAKRSVWRAAAEREWLNLEADNGQPVHIFRLPGIYGLGRSAFDRLRSGSAKRIDKPGHLFSRIHVDDIAGALIASMSKSQPGAIYNICDDEPAPQHTVIEYAASLIDLPAPPLIPFEAADLSPMARSFYDDNRRVKNDLMKSKLGYKLAYPTYREGLASILAEESGG